MKKALALVLVLCIAFGALTACAATETAVEGEKTYKVAMSCDSSISDGGWGAAC